MEKTIKAGKKSIKLTNRVKWLVIYKNQFGKDIMPSLIPIANTLVELAFTFARATGGNVKGAKLGDMMRGIDISDVQSALYSLAGLESTDILQIVWSMAKAADDDLENYDDWLDSLDAFPVDAILPVIFDLNTKALLTSKNYSRLQSVVEALKSTTENSTSTES